METVKITELIKDKQYQYIAFVILAIALLTALSSFKEQKQLIKTKTFISNDMKFIEKVILSWSEYGYKVQSITSQSISAFAKYDSRYSSMHPDVTIYKGDILLVMIKE